MTKADITYAATTYVAALTNGKTVNEMVNWLSSELDSFDDFNKYVVLGVVAWIAGESVNIHERLNGPLLTDNETAALIDSELREQGF